MTIEKSNLLYRLKCDDTYFEYRPQSKLAGVILALLGMNKRLFLPHNNILRYSVTNRWYGLAIEIVMIHSSIKKPGRLIPKKIKPLWCLPHQGLVPFLLKKSNEVERLNLNRQNVSLMNIDHQQVRAFYSAVN